MLDSVINPLLHWLLQTSLHASLIVILIMIVRLIFKSRLKPGWSYVLWMVLLCRMLMPEPFSIQMPALLHSIHPLQLSQHYSPHTPLRKTINTDQNQPINSFSTLPEIKNTINFDLKILLFSIWLCGLFLVIGCYINKLILTLRHIRHCHVINDPQILATLDLIKSNLSINRNIDIKLSNHISSPACFGIINPVILLPENAVDLDRGKLALVLEHELLHHKRQDIAIDALMTLLKSLHWFNPLIWVAHTLMREDCELSCDFRVTYTKDEALKRLYAGLLIKFASKPPVQSSAYSITLMSANYTCLSGRISHLLEQPKSSLYKSVQTTTLTTCIAAICLTSPPAALAIETITFDYSTSQGISAFSSKRPNNQSYLLNQKNKRISGILTQPEKDGKHPAVILVHGCEGFDQRHKKWARHLNDLGYITFRIQRHGITTPYCEKPIAQINTFTASQVMDAYAAMDYLRTQDFIDVNNINIMSWESWGAIGAAATFGIGQVYLNQFNTAIAMYPDCTATYNGEFNSPLLIMVGDSDEWAQANDCTSIQTMASKSKTSPVEVKVYDNTYHGFDHPELTDATFLPYAKNLGHLSTTGATAKYNHQAYLDARMRIETFLSENFAVK